MPFGFADNVSVEEEQRQTSQAKGSREKNHRKGILVVMTEKRGRVRGKGQDPKPKLKGKWPHELTINEIIKRHGRILRPSE